MAEMFSTLGTWNWLIFGFILMALELLAPGIFLFWLGLAALLVGLLSFVINPSWQTQLLLFAIFAVAAVPAWRHFARSASSNSVSNPFLNRRTEALVGREFTLEKPIVGGSGTVRIDDTIWRVAGPDAPAGSRVKVVQADGASLTVAAAQLLLTRSSRDGIHFARKRYARACSTAPRSGGAAGRSRSTPCPTRSGHSHRLARAL